MLLIQSPYLLFWLTLPGVFSFHSSLARTPNHHFHAGPLGHSCTAYALKNFRVLYSQLSLCGQNFLNLCSVYTVIHDGPGPPALSRKLLLRSLRLEVPSFRTFFWPLHQIKARFLLCLFSAHLWHFMLLIVALFTKCCNIYFLI